MKFTPEHEQIADTVRKFVAKEINPHVRRVGGRAAVPQPRGVQEARRPRPAGHQVPDRVRRHGPRLQLLDGDGRGAGRLQLRRRADGHRRADRHVHAGAGALRLATSCSASSSRPPSPATWWAASASARPAAAPTWRRSRPRRARTATTTSSTARKMWITNGMQADWCCLLANTSRGRAAHEQDPDHRAAWMRPASRKQKIHKIGMHCVGHRAAVLRQRARAAAQPDRPGRHGLHLPDAAVPGGAAVGRGELAARRSTA